MLAQHSSVDGRVQGWEQIHWSSVFKVSPVNHLKAHGLMGKNRGGASNFPGLFPGSDPDAVSTLKAGRASAE